MGNNLSNCLTVCTSSPIPVLVICQYICGIHLTEIFRTCIFKIRLKMKYTHDDDMPTFLAISRIWYLPSLSLPCTFLTLEAFALSVRATVNFLYPFLWLIICFEYNKPHSLSCLLKLGVRLQLFFTFLSNSLAPGL